MKGKMRIKFCGLNRVFHWNVEKIYEKTKQKKNQIKFKPKIEEWTAWVFERGLMAIQFSQHQTPERKEEIQRKKKINK